jgi:SAM-dependent methyltransferase
MPHRWDDVAQLRKEQIEQGLDLTFSEVFVPYFRSKVAALSPRTILEVGGGTGHLAQALRPLTKSYVMLEPSGGMYRTASVLLSTADVVVHNCSLESFVSTMPFDMVLSHLCVQTVSNVDHFFLALAKQLTERGGFLVSLPHPAFYNDYKKFFATDTFEYMQPQSAEVSFSISLDPARKIEGVPYYHRPLSYYVRTLYNAGLCLTILDEIFPSKEVQQRYGSPWESPRYLVLGGQLHCQISQASSP